VLSLQLPFAILPLIRFTNTTSLMGAFTSPKWLRVVAYSAALLIISLNVWLVVRALGPDGALESAGAIRWVFAAVGLFCGALLIWITFSPLRLTSPHTQTPQKPGIVLHNG
jgi:manganese transport protein